MFHGFFYLRQNGLINVNLVRLTDFLFNFAIDFLINILISQ